MKRNYHHTLFCSQQKWLRELQNEKKQGKSMYRITKQSSVHKLFVNLTQHTRSLTKRTFVLYLFCMCQFLYSSHRNRTQLLEEILNFIKELLLILEILFRLVFLSNYMFLLQNDFCYQRSPISSDSILFIENESRSSGIQIMLTIKPPTIFGARPSIRVDRN